MKLSARNQLQGVIKEVTKGATTTIVKIEVKNPAVITHRSPMKLPRT